MEYKVYKENNYTIHAIKTDKFRNCVMEIIFTQEIDKKKTTSRTFLNDLLCFTSEKYKTRRELTIELENLYSSYVRCNSFRYGNRAFTSFYTSFLDPKYCEEGYLEDIIHLPFELLFNPYIEDGKFNKRSFDIVKNKLKAELESIKNNSTRLAVRRSLEAMDKTSVSSINITGYLEDLDDITTSSLVDTYNELINDSMCDIYVAGNLDMEEIVKLIKKYMKKEKVLNKDIDIHVENKTRDQVQDVEDSERYEQSSLIVLNNLVGLTERERNYVFNVFNYIFGNGGLTSKLYKYIREENSLCYALDSSYEKYDALCMFYMGINQKDKNKCLELINKALQEMINGEFSDEELVDAKKSISTMIRASQDSIGGIINTYLFHELDGLPLVDEKIENYNSVTKEEIMNVAKKIKVNTCYLLKGEDEK